MKRLFALMLVCCLCLLAGCGGIHNGVNEKEKNRTERREETPAVEQTGGGEVAAEYAFSVDTESRDDFSDEGKLLQRFTHQMMVMSVENGEDLSDEARRLALEKAEIFNDVMMRHRRQARERSAENREWIEEARAQGYSGTEYVDETTVGGTRCGRIVSVWMANYSYLGGAHPGYATHTMLFDLEKGAFIDPVEVADDPDAFLEGAAALLIEKAEADEERLPGYWEDYKDIISRWNEGAVLFHETGMRVIYSPYDLGPYVLGEVVLEVSYDELQELLGPGGLQRLDVSAGN